jgi:hypothetical protein
VVFCVAKMKVHITGLTIFSNGVNIMSRIIDVFPTINVLRPSKYSTKQAVRTNNKCWKSSGISVHSFCACRSNLRVLMYGPFKTQITDFLLFLEGLFSGCVAINEWYYRPLGSWPLKNNWPVDDHLTLQPATPVSYDEGRYTVNE